MAGMPPSLIDRANDILKQLEEKHVDEELETRSSKSETGTNKGLKQNIKKLLTPQMQLSIFDAHSETFKNIRQMLEDFDINRLTPVEALMKLNEIKQLLK
jgi:DNA mismatch repair protein MutS